MVCTTGSSPDVLATATGNTTDMERNRSSPVKSIAGFKNIINFDDVTVDDIFGGLDDDDHCDIFFDDILIGSSPESVIHTEAYTSGSSPRVFVVENIEKTKYQKSTKEKLLRQLLLGSYNVLRSPIPDMQPSQWLVNSVRIPCGHRLIIGG